MANILYQNRLSLRSKVFIDPEECISCWTWVQIREEVFGLDETDRRAFIIMQEGGPENLIDEAIESCPLECIYGKDR